MPEVGDRIRLVYSEGNRNTWSCAGEVRAIVDGCLIVKRWNRRRRCHFLHVVDPFEWSIFPFEHLPKRGRGEPIPVTAA